MRTLREKIGVVLVFVLTVAAALGVVFTVYNQDRKDPKAMEASRLGENVDFVLTAASVRTTDNRGNRWQLTAKTIAYDIDKETASLSDLVVNLLPRGGDPLQIGSGEGLLSMKNGTMLFRRDVEVLTASGSRLRTARLLYEEGKKKLSSDADVKVSSNMLVLSGRGMEFFLGDRDFRIISNINAEIGK